MKPFMKMSYGITLCAVIAIPAHFFASYIPIGAITIAIIAGIVLGNLIKSNESFKAGIDFSEKQLLPFSIALMGVNLNFLILNELGLKSIFIIISGIVFTLCAALVLAKLFKFDIKFALLIGIGNAICGSSAIAATEGILGVEKENVGLAVTVVNFLGTIGIFLLPLLSTTLFKFDSIGTGLLIGNTLQAVGQVVAAGFSVNDLAGQTATIVKMARILMLTPIVLILIFMFFRRKTTQQAKPQNGIPWFIVGFMLFSLIPTFELLSDSLIKIIATISEYILIVAMAAIGLKIKMESILRDGRQALLLGSLIFVLQIAFSATLVWLFL